MTPIYTGTESYNGRCICVYSCSRSIDGKKVTKLPGVDGITPKLLKVSAEIITAAPSVICNNAISQCKYHLEWKKITPLTKSSDGDMKKALFRQVTVLPALNNVFEKILASQLTSYFQKIFCDFLSAYRRHHGCQTILFIVEEWKKSRVKEELVASDNGFIQSI